MFGFLINADSLFHYKKLGADVATGSTLGVINDQNALILNIVVIVGRIVIELLARRKARKQEEKKND
jgi:hypothetical protein